MTKYKPYPEYKESGVEWVGNIPNHWSVLPLYSVTSFLAIKNLEGMENNVLSLSYGNIIRRNVDRNFGLLPESFNTYQIVDKGDIILRLTDLQNDKRSLRVGWASERGIITPAYLKLSCLSALDDKYLYRLLHSYDTTKVFYGMGGGLRQSMKFEDMRRLELLVPPLPEQQKIATFLDHETGKIDELIQKQENLIALLEEKRQAVISHAVTKGLDPTAPMKDSKVEWLGQIPDHWERAKFNLCVSIANGQVDPRKAPYSEMLLIAPNHIESGTGKIIGQESAKEQGADSGKYWCDKGDVIYSKIRPALRKVAIAPESCLCSADMYPMKGQAGLTNEYVYWFLLTDSFSTFAILESDRVAMPKINRESLGGCYIPRPSKEEQIKIDAHIKKISVKTDELLLKAKSAIELMQERRTALISAAVTGKIKVV